MSEPVFTLETLQSVMADLERAGEEIIALRAQVAAAHAEVERLTDLLREAYDYLPMAISLAEELATMFPDLARPQDK